jgi:hypothetical protein
MADEEADHQQWRKCWSGELRALARQHRRQRVVKSALFGAIGLMVVAAGVVAGRSMRPGPASVGSINCEQCVAQFEAYFRHLIHESQMEARSADLMRVHLAQCARCRNAFDKRYPGVLMAVATDAVSMLVGINHLPVATMTELLAGTSP